MARTVLVPISWTEEPLNRELRCPGLGLRPRFLPIQPQSPSRHLDPIAPRGSSAMVPDYLKLRIWVLVYLQFPFLLCSAMHWNILSIMFDPGLLFLVSCHRGYLYLLASAHSWLVLCVRPTPNFFSGFSFLKIGYQLDWGVVYRCLVSFSTKIPSVLWSHFFKIFHRNTRKMRLSESISMDAIQLYKLNQWIGLRVLLIGKLRILSG